jgi:mutator protein MutT
MTDIQPVQRVLALVLKRDDRLLVCQRPAHKRHGGLWEFPGGKVEPGESDFHASVREASEELGVKVVRAGPIEFSAQDPGSPFVIDFLSVDVEGEPICIEHTALAWLTPRQLLEISLAPCDRHYVEHLMASA